MNPQSVGLIFNLVTLLNTYFTYKWDLGDERKEEELRVRERCWNERGGRQLLEVVIITDFCKNFMKLFNIISKLFPPMQYVN